MMVAMVATADNRAEFANNVVAFLRQRNLDGFDL